MHPGRVPLEGGAVRERRGDHGGGGRRHPRRRRIAAADLTGEHVGLGDEHRLGPLNGFVDQFLANGDEGRRGAVGAG
jgi:hypothetical protein